MTIYVNGTLQADTGNLDELSRLALIASDASYKGRLSNLGDPLKPFDDTPQYGNPQPPFGFEFLLLSTNYKVDQVFDDPQDLSGFKAIAYRNNVTKDVILAFAGTDGPDARDWWGNILHLGWNQWDKNSDQIRAYLAQFFEPDTGTPSVHIHFVGQSLGGALAQYAAYSLIADHASQPQFDSSKLSLVTFNALGGVAALADHVDGFDIGLLEGLGQAVHYFVENDLVHRLGAGHIGGVTKEFLWTNNTAPATSAFNRLDPVDAHRIESAFYTHLSGAKGFFDEAVRAPIEYLPVSNIQKLTSAFGNIENKSTVRESEAFFQIVAGMIPASIDAPPSEINAVMRAFLTAYRNAGEIAPVKAEILFDTNWSKLFRSVADTNPRLVSESYAGALLLGFLGAAFEKTLDDVRNYLEPEFGQLAVPTLEDRSLAAYDAQTRLLAERTTPGTPLARQFVDKEELARRLATEQHPITSALSYLASAAAGAGLTGIALGTFIGEAFKQAGEAVVVAATEAGDAVTEYESDISAALVDVAHAVANTSDDYLDHVAGSLVLPVQAFFPEARTLADGLLAAVQETNLLSLFVTDAEAAEQASSAVSLVSEALQTVSIRQGRTPNPFASPDFDPDASISLGSLSEGSVRTFTLYLPYDAGTGGQRVRLTLAGGAAYKLTLLDRGNEIPLGADGGFTLVVPEGRKELSFGLWANEDIDAAETLELKAQLTELVGTEEVATHQEHVELDLALDGVDETTPVAAREIHGDWAPMPYVDPDTGATYYKYDDLGNIERLPGVPSTGDVELDLWLDGSGGNDLIVTGDFDEQAHGDAGDDFITGSDRSGNVLYGGSGNDRIEGGGWADHVAESVDYLGRTMGLGDDKIYGGAGDDQIWGESEAAQAALNDSGTAPTGIAGDWLTGGSGADRLYGSAGDDVLLGGTGEDLLVGGAGMDVLLGDDDYQIRPAGNYWQVVHPNFGDSTSGFGGFEVGLFPVVNATSAAPDAIWAISGDPEFAYYKFGGGADVLIGGGGDDILIGEYGDDTLYGGEGDDILAGWEGDDELIGGAGDDMMAGDFGRYEQMNQRTVPGTLLVQAGVMGTFAAYGSAPELAGNDLLDGGAGDDVLYGEAGDDSLLGGDGDDMLYGDAAYLPESLHGNDILDGGGGDDVLYAGAGEDALYGGGGDDELHGGPGNDRLEGGGGDDALYGDQGGDTLSAGDGNDALYGGDGADELRAGAGDDRLYGADGDDVLYGDSGADLLDGGEGSDRLYGGNGADVIEGGGGDDLIDGGEGIDALRGGAGDDTYVLGFGYGRDAIEDGEGANRIRFGSGILPEDLRAELDGDTLTATLVYTGIDDAVSLDMSDFALGGIDFIDGSAWTPKQLSGLIPALVTSGWGDDDALEGNPNLRNALHGGGGDDSLTGAAWDDLLDGGDGADTSDGRDGSDIYFFAGTESGIDLVADSGIDTNAYLDAYYAALGIADWRLRDAHGGEYHVAQQAEGWAFDVYYDSYEQALAENPDAAIDFVEPLPELAPAVQRDDAAALDELIAEGTVARDAVRFGPGVTLADLELRVAVPAASADAYPEAPWHDGGTLSVRWGAGGFDVAVPGASYGFSGPSLPADPDSYRLGEGIEAFELDDGTTYTLDEVLAQAAVLPLAGEYHLGRDAGLQAIAPNYRTIVFDDFIRAYEVKITRDGADLVLDVGDGNTMGRIAGWYGAGGLTPPTGLSFYADPPLDAAAVTAAGLELHGTEGDDLLLGLDGYADHLYGEGGNDVLDGGTGDDTLEGGDGTDAYVLSAGGGHDTVENPYYWIWPSSDDRILVADGLGPDDVLVSRGYGDVSVWVRGSATRIQVPDWSYGDARRLAGIEFADGTFWSADEMEARFEPAPGTAGDDAIFGSDGDDVIDALAGDDYVETGAGNDIVRGGPGADDLEAWGEGNNLLDAGPGDDTVYEEGRTLVIGGKGDDWIEHYGDGGVIAFNPGDGDDIVYAAGAMTLSIGGGVKPADLSLSHDGGALLLDVAGAGSIRLTREWEADPAAWPEITLQLYGSVHRYDFNAAIGTEGTLGDVLAANEISFSETDGVGGAIAWQYGIFGSTGALSDELLGSVLADPGFGVASQPIVLEQPNRPPELAHPISDQSTLEDSPFQLSAAAAFTDSDAGDSLAFDAALLDGSPLPVWLAFDAASGSLAGTPGNDDVGTLEIAVGATDGEGERAQDAFALEVVNVNDPPYLVAPLADQNGQEGAALAFSVAGAFADVDAGDVLAFAATLADGGALPGWLAFDPASQSFSAAPGYSDGGSYLVRVTATDAAGASASGDLTLDILEAEPPVEPGHDGNHGRHDEDHEHHHGRGHNRGHNRGHDREHKPEGHKHRHDPVQDWLAKSHHFDFEAIARELEHHEPHPVPSPAEIRVGWERVARHAAKLRAGDDEFEHGAPWHSGDLLRLAPNGGHAFGFDASTGAARTQEGFTSFRGLSEGFRRL